jgi:hypothetical protein
VDLSLRADADVVFHCPPPRRFLLWRAVSAIAAVLHPSGAILLAADRARVADGDWIAEGVMRPLAEAPKLLHLPNDVVIVFAGKASYITPANDEVSLVDLAVTAAGDASGPAEAANAVRQVFDNHANAVRAHVGVGAFACPPVLTTAYTVAMAAGCGANGPVATLIALTEHGPCAVQTLFDSVAFAPAAAQPALSAAVYAAASTPSVTEARELLVAGVRDAAVHAPNFVGFDVDLATIDSGATTLTEAVFSPAEHPPG